MCGIAGFINSKCSESHLSAMLLAMKHRGPDDEGIFVDEKQNIGLAQVRLSIIDLSMGGHQPMWGKDKQHVIVFNGEIYNFHSIKIVLVKLGHTFHSSSDTEVLLKAYEVWGTECLQRINGMFAFAIYDQVKQILFLARDRFGEKPLYFYQGSDNEFIFASEIRGLLATGRVKAELNLAVLPEFLAFQTVHRPATLLKDVNLLEPGTYLVVDRHTVQKRRYWQPAICENTNDVSGAANKVLELFIESVKGRLISDAPLGAFLSGGIDSTILVGVASSMVRSFNTYTVAFDDAAFKDGYYAEIAAKKFGTQHHEIKLSMKDVVHQVPEALGAIDHPSADGVNTYIISKAVRTSGIEVALSGLGGDEIFGGYASFRQLSGLTKTSRNIKRVPAVIRKALARMFLNNQSSIPLLKKAHYLQSDLSMEDNYLLTRRYFFPQQIRKLMPEGKSVVSKVEVLYHRTDQFYSAISTWEMEYYMHDVLLRDTDQMSMANSLEVRTPFLDFPLIEYVLGLPDSMKFERDVNKSLFVNALKEFIPEELKHRPKQGFSMPFDRWMRNELQSFCEQRINYLESIDLFHSGSVRYFWNFFLKKNQSVNWARLWLLVSLSYWMERNSIECPR